MNKIKAGLLGVGLSIAGATSSMAEGTDLFSSLQTSATAAVAAALAVVGVVLLAGIAKPVAEKAYGVVKGVIRKF